MSNKSENLSSRPLDLNPSFQVKDVRVPEQLMRAMAAEAEAARNARAKVILMVTLMVTVMMVVVIVVMVMKEKRTWQGYIWYV